MEPGIYVENLKNRGTEVQLSERFYRECLAALGGAGEDSAMVLDDRGEVLFCNDEAATVFDCTADDLVGKHLSEFVHNIRLNAWAPGSNMAYAAFSGSRKQWREYCVLDSRGHGFPVELQLDVLVVNLRSLILLWVRTPARQTRNQDFDGRAGRVANAGRRQSEATRV